MQYCPIRKSLAQNHRLGIRRRMKKKYSHGRESFLRGWKKHLLELSRKHKTYLPTPKAPTRMKGLEKKMIANPVINFIEKISLKHGDDVGFNKFDGTIFVPKVFSFFEQPEVALSFIYRATRLISESRKSNVTLNYSRSNKFCLGAECLLSLALSEARKINPNFEGNVLINGIYPRNEQHLEIIRDVGIVREIHEENDVQIEDSSNKKDDIKQLIFYKDSIGKENPTAFADDTKNLASEQFTNYINQCLDHYGLELIEDAAERLISCMGELLDNAERHCGLSQRPRWHVRGYVNHDHSQPVCDVAVFNFGKSIPESFNSLPTDHYSFKNHIEPYVRKHQKTKGLNRDALITIAALQERVSSHNVEKKHSNGTGTVELLEVFQGMHDHLRQIQGEDILKPVMSLITGTTHIRFDGKFRLIPLSLKDGNATRLTYPFNAVGLEEPPERTYINVMKNVKFPGVMINIRFPLPNNKVESAPSEEVSK